MVPGDSAKLTNREAGAAAPPPLPGYATARVDLYLGLRPGEAARVNPETRGETVGAAGVASALAAASESG